MHELISPRLIISFCSMHLGLSFHILFYKIFDDLSFPILHFLLFPPFFDLLAHIYINVFILFIYLEIASVVIIYISDLEIKKAHISNGALYIGKISPYSNK